MLVNTILTKPPHDVVIGAFKRSHDSNQDAKVCVNTGHYGSRRRGNSFRQTRPHLDSCLHCSVAHCHGYQAARHKSKPHRVKGLAAAMMTLSRLQQNQYMNTSMQVSTTRILKVV